MLEDDLWGMCSEGMRAACCLCPSSSEVCGRVLAVYLQLTELLWRCCRTQNMLVSCGLQ